MTNAAGCTIVAKNYLPMARVLAASWAEHHPGVPLATLVLDDEVANDWFTEGKQPWGRRVAPSPGSTGPASMQGAVSGESSYGLPWILHPQDIGIPTDELHRRAMLYNVLELSTSLKPWLLSYLLDSGFEVAIYLDPDIWVLASLEEAWDKASEHGIALTPHVLDPLPEDGLLPGEREIMASGVYNLGFIAVSSKASDFLTWWAKHLRRHCRVAPEEMVFVDQRYIDLAVTVFEHYVISDYGWNLAYWNLHERPLERKEGGLHTRGLPVRFVHFSGYDPLRPWVISRHQGDRPRVLLSENPLLAEVFSEYGKRLLEEGFSERDPYGFDTLPSGIRVDRFMRKLYRRALEEYEGQYRQPDSSLAAKEEPPDPFVGNDFLEWLKEPEPSPYRTNKLSRYLKAVWASRPDLMAAYPDPDGADYESYRKWLWGFGRYEESLPEPLLLRPLSPGGGPSPHGAPRVAARGQSIRWASPEQLRPGVNAIGLFRDEAGVGKAARMTVKALAKTGVAYRTLTYDITDNWKGASDDLGGTEDEHYDINLVFVNADGMAKVVKDFGPEAFSGRYTIGYWVWETEFPPSWALAGVPYVDEVWVPTRFVARSIRSICDKPIRIVPHPIELPPASGTDRATKEARGDTYTYTFLFAFDYQSVMERKNPLGLIEAFHRAFPEGDEARLVIKTLAGEKRLSDRERLRMAARGVPGVVIAEEHLSDAETSALISSADCYVSLHRSEGFGLTIAEAMAAGRPVIATEYSGNVDFMNKENAYPVPFRMVPIPPSCHPYQEGHLWAEPDLEMAARLMRHVYEHREEAAAKGVYAREEIARRLSLDAVAEIIAGHLDDIRGH